MAENGINIMGLREMKKKGEGIQQLIHGFVMRHFGVVGMAGEAVAIVTKR